MLFKIKSQSCTKTVELISLISSFVLAENDELMKSAAAVCRYDCTTLQLFCTFK